MANKRILVVEDFPEIAELICDLLRGAGYEPVPSDSATCGARLFDAEEFCMAVLDVNLKEGTGYDVCRHVRAHDSRSGVPIVMLTSRDSLEEKSEGFSSGADVFLSKPLNGEELLMWVAALLKRASGNWSDAAALRSGPVSINPETRTVEVNGKPVAGLTAREFDLLLELARAKPDTVTKERLYERVWQGKPPATNSLEVHIRSIRKKLGPLGQASVVTLRGVGYRFE